MHSQREDSSYTQCYSDGNSNPSLTLCGTNARSAVGLSLSALRSSSLITPSCCEAGIDLLHRWISRLDARNASTIPTCEYHTHTLSGM